MTYCESGDLLLGNVPVPSSAEKYIEQAADEIDSYLGLQYVTPVILDEANPKYRSGSLLLKRINIWLASGRLLMALDAAGEDDQVHQYAERLVNEALAALKMITDGSIVIPGAEPINPETNKVTGPLASWADDASAVETFNDTFGNPAADATRRQTELPYRGYLNPFDVYTY
jgi:hypothetical protein